MKIRYLIIPFLLMFSYSSFAGEGMWLPILLKQLNEAEMKRMGMKMSAEDIYSVNHGSLKDAIVQFGGGCTAEIISSQGLLLTNHHCGFGQIQSHTTLENNYVNNGFWAKNKTEELPNPGLTAMFIISMEDVTKKILSGTSSNMKHTEKQKIISQNIKNLSQQYQKKKWQDILIKSFYKDNAYYLFVTETFTDVRLVGAPPQSIGNFGVDTDNWIWPRHTGDFSLFRIYADSNNHPASFSKNNVPFKPKKYLNISMDGIEENDFTLVFGFPGRTDEYIPASSLEMIQNISNPAKIKLRTQSLDIINKYMRNDVSNKIKYVSKAARISNGWKKWQGELDGLQRSNALNLKLQDEKEFQIKVESNPTWNAEYGSVLKNLNIQNANLKKYILAKEYYFELLSVNIEAFRHAPKLKSLIQIYEKNGPAEFELKWVEFQNAMKGFYKDFNAQIDQEICVALMKSYHEDIETEYQLDALNELFLNNKNIENKIANLYQRSILSNQENLEKINSLSAMEQYKAISVDSLYLFYLNFWKMYNEKIEPEISKIESNITELLSSYMKAQIEIFPKNKIYPDANSTLRVTYGNVKSYKPRDAVKYGHQTFLDGVIEKYKIGDYEFDLPKKLLDLYEKKDFGPYGENGKMPVAFIGTNHTTGGNSGSPALDAYGNLIGLNFDRVWEGTMSDLNYDPSLCRNIMVDIRYILFTIDKFAGAKWIVDEMQLVHPKNIKKSNTCKQKKSRVHKIY